MSSGVVLMRPTLSYAQHYETLRAPQIDARAFRQGWQVTTRLEALFRDGAISAAAYEAGHQFRRDFEIGLLRRRSPIARLPGELDGSERESTRIVALGRLRGAIGFLGSFQAALVEACAVHDRSWEAIGRELSVTRKTALSWTAAALGRLAGFSAAPSRGDA
jgi:hypothetical protein